MPTVNVLMVKSTTVNIDGQDRFYTKNGTYPFSEEIAAKLIAERRGINVTSTDTDASTVVVTDE